MILEGGITRDVDTQTDPNDKAHVENSALGIHTRGRMLSSVR